MFNLLYYFRKRQWWKSNERRFRPSSKDSKEVKKLKAKYKLRYEWPRDPPSQNLYAFLTVIQTPGFFHCMIHTYIALIGLCGDVIDVIGLEKDNLWLNFHKSLRSYKRMLSDGDMKICGQLVSKLMDRSKETIRSIFLKDERSAIYCDVVYYVELLRRYQSRRWVPDIRHRVTAVFYGWACWSCLRWMFLVKGDKDGLNGKSGAPMHDYCANIPQHMLRFGRGEQLLGETAFEGSDYFQKLRDLKRTFKLKSPLDRVFMNLIEEELQKIAIKTGNNTKDKQCEFVDKNLRGIDIDASTWEVDSVSVVGMREVMQGLDIYFQQRNEDYKQNDSISMDDFVDFYEDGSMSIHGHDENQPYFLLSTISRNKYVEEKKTRVKCEYAKWITKLETFVSTEDWKDAQFLDQPHETNNKLPWE